MFSSDAEESMSALGRRFNAQLTVTPRADGGLYLVVGRVGSPDLAVATIGGQVLVRLPNQTHVLALIPSNTERALKAHPDVALAGAVTIDPVRFAQFARLAGLDMSADAT